MTRAKWLQLSLKGGTKYLVESLKNRPFFLDSPVSSGFRLEQAYVDSVIGQFVSKRTVDQKITLPSGEEFVQEIANIEITEFRVDLKKNKGIITLFNPPRSLTPFLSAFSQATNFTCAIEPIEVNVFNWVELVLQKVPGSLVTFADIVEVKIDNEVQARVAFASSVNIMGNPSLHTLFDQGGRVESAKVKFTQIAQGIVVELGRRGTIRMSTPLPAMEVRMLCETMLEAAYSGNSDF